MPREIRLGCNQNPWRYAPEPFGSRDGDFGGDAAHFGQRLSLGLRDLGFRHLRAAGDEILELGLGLGGKTFGVGLGALDDFGRFLLGVGRLLLVFGQQRHGFRLQARGLFKLRLDARTALVECLSNRLVHTDIQTGRRRR